MHENGTAVVRHSEINNDSNNGKVNQERNVQCDECYIYVLTKDQLRTHKRLKHEEVINYSCEHCSYSCSTTNQLNQHMKGTHFICDKCKYITSTKEELNKHLKDIHKEDSINVHKCNDCSFVAKSIDNLNNHVKIHRILGKDVTNVIKYSIIKKI